MTANVVMVVLEFMGTNDKRRCTSVVLLVHIDDGAERCLLSLVSVVTSNLGNERERDEGENEEACE